jgi:hypothetical protein
MVDGGNFMDEDQSVQPAERMIGNENESSGGRDIFLPGNRGINPHKFQPGFDKFVVPEVPVSFKEKIQFILVNNPFQVIYDEGGNYFSEPRILGIQDLFDINF